MNFFDIILNSIDFLIVALVLASGFFQSRYMTGFKLSKTNEGLDSALKTLGVSFVVSAIYILILQDPDKPSNWAKYFLSYFFATSFYELIVDPFVNFVKKKLGSDK
jgi:hypothetical protein